MVIPTASDWRSSKAAVPALLVRLRPHMRPLLGLALAALTLVRSLRRPPPAGGVGRLDRGAQRRPQCLLVDGNPPRLRLVRGETLAAPLRGGIGGLRAGFALQVDDRDLTGRPPAAGLVAAPAPA